MREYNEDIEKILKRTFEIAVKDSEWGIRHLAEWNILFEGIDKTLEYVNGGKVGKLFLNSNMWYVLNDALVSVLALYDLKLIGNEKITEHEEVVPINYLYYINGNGFEIALKYRGKQCTIEDLKKIYEKEIIERIHNNENDETIQNAWCKELIDLINNKLSCKNIVENLQSIDYIINQIDSEDEE